MAEVIEVHNQVLRRHGGTPGVLTRGSIASAIERCRWGPFEAIPDLADRTALLLRGLCQDHPFADGNKRTASASAEFFLLKNGVRLAADGDEIVRFMLDVAQGYQEPGGIAEWIRRHSRTIKTSEE